MKEYLTAIQKDIEDEIETSALNRRDCQRDQVCLYNLLKICEKQDFSKADSALIYYFEVSIRGVFREFPPKTFDMMLQSGDARLIKDLNLRAKLASNFSFRKDVLEVDLKNFDQEVRICNEKMGKYINSWFLYSNEINNAWIEPRWIYQISSKRSDSTFENCRNA